MKKFISILLSVVMLTGTAAITANAANVDEAEVGAHRYAVKDTTKIKNGQIRFYTYNFTKSNPETGISVINTKTQERNDYYFNDINGYKQINVPCDSPMEHWLILENSRIGTRNKNYDNTEGENEKIKFKLSDYSDYFNSDGTHTEDGFNFNFTTQKRETAIYSSALVFYSGGIFTAVTPSKDGYVEIYVSKNIGETTNFFSAFRRVTSNSVRSYGGKNGEYFSFFTMGNADLTGYGVTVDDVTAIQSYSAGIEDFEIFKSEMQM